MSNNNLNLPGVKRLLREAKELNSNISDFNAYPLEENIFEWHFTIRGPPDTPYQGGLYHGRILFPNQYPVKPPAIIFMTPSGRFQVDKKICLSVSNYHPEEWLPSWGVRTILTALVAFFPTNSEGSIGSANVPDADKIRLAASSKSWVCPVCNKPNEELLCESDNVKENTEPVADSKIEIFFKTENSEISVSDVKDEEINTESQNVGMDAEEKVTNKGWCGRINLKLHRSKIDKKILKTMNSTNDEGNNLEISLPFYDWVPEYEKDLKESESQAKSPKLIPETLIKEEDAFKTSFHVRYVSVIVFLSLILMFLAKRGFGILFFLLVDTILYFST